MQLQMTQPAMRANMRQLLALALVLLLAGRVAAEEREPSGVEVVVSVRAHFELHVFSPSRPLLQTPLECTWKLITLAVYAASPMPQIGNKSKKKQPLSTCIEDAGIAIRLSQGYTFSILQGPETDFI